VTNTARTCAAAENRRGKSDVEDKSFFMVRFGSGAGSEILRQHFLRIRRRCGWLKDKFGVSWQVNPVVLGDMLADPKAGKAERVMKAMREMDNIDIAALEKAAKG
jgi:predicted 3-demethylubiquinone-9 3-methyltransferase (glyoxalase superfamily)